MAKKSKPKPPPEPAPVANPERDHDLQGCEVSTATYQRDYLKDRYLVGYRRMDATGTRRRLQGLLRLGWSLREVGKETGLDRFSLSSITRGDIGDRVNRSTFVLVDGFYREHLYPAPDTPTSRRMVSRALKYGYPSPFVWNDIDDICEVPSA